MVPLHHLEGRNASRGGTAAEESHVIKALNSSFKVELPWSHHLNLKASPLLLLTVKFLFLSCIYVFIIYVCACVYVCT